MFRENKKNTTSSIGSNGRYLRPLRFPNLSLNSKLFVSMIFLFFCGVVFTMILSERFTRRTVKNLTLQRLQVIADNNVRLLESWLEEKRQFCVRISEVGTVKKRVQENPSNARLNSSEKSTLKNELESYFKQFPTYANEYKWIAILDKDFHPVFSTGLNDDKENNGILQADDLKQFLETLTESKVSDPFLHPSTGEPTIIVGTCLQRHDTGCVAYLIMEIEYNSLDVLFHQFNLGRTGETFLVNNDHILITQSRFKNRDSLLRNRISTPGVKAAFSKFFVQGLFNNYDGIKVFGVYRYISEMDWVIAVEQEMAEAMGVESITLNAALLPVVVVFLLMLLVTRMIVRNSLSPLNFIENQMNEISRGDLRGQITISKDDEIGRLVSCFNDMNNALRDILINIRNLMRKFKKSIGVIGVSLDEHDQTAAHQAIAIKQTAESLDDLNSSAENVLSNAREVQTRVEDTMQAILNLSSQADEIREMSSSIDEVSIKINLLSLNASIEAARAGEHGRGFGVVAGEIRKLAEHTNELTERISNQIAVVQKLVQSTMVSAEVMVSEVTQIGQSVERQTNGTSQIAKAIDAIKEGISQSANGASEISNSAGELQDMAQQIHALFEQLQLDGEPVTV